MKTSQKTINTPQKKILKNPKLSGKFDSTIQVIEPESGKTPPIVGYFPSGVDPITTSLKSNNNNPPIVKTLRNEKRPKRLEIVVKVDGSKVDYVGNNYSGEAAAGKIGVNRLAIVDKISRTISFVPIASGKVFRLEPKLRKPDKSAEEPSTPAKTELTNDERNERLGTLSAHFGTQIDNKRKRKALQLKQLDDAETQQELKQILGNTHVDKAALESASTMTNPNIPPFDVSATTPANAYPLDKIILSGEWDYVKDVLQLLEAEEELKSDAYPSFVCNRSHKVVLLKDEEERKKVAGILSYITHLVNFKNKHSLDGFTSAKNQKIPSMLLQKFTKMFLNNERKKIADDKIGAILSYVLVLTLHIDEFETDFTDIAKDLKMSEISLRPHFENLGCKLKSRNKVLIATLPVPLVFKKLGKRKRRG